MPAGADPRRSVGGQTSNAVIIDVSTSTVFGALPLGDRRLSSDLGPQNLKRRRRRRPRVSRDGSHLDVVSATTTPSPSCAAPRTHRVLDLRWPRLAQRSVGLHGQRRPGRRPGLLQVDILDALHGEGIGHVTTHDGRSKSPFLR